VPRERAQSLGAPMEVVERAEQEHTVDALVGEVERHGVGEGAGASRQVTTDDLLRPRELDEAGTAASRSRSRQDRRAHASPLARRRAPWLDPRASAPGVAACVAHRVALSLPLLDLRLRLKP